MDVPRRIARSRIAGLIFAALFAGGLPGCSEWASNFSPSDMWDSMTDKDNWEKLSPSNLFYRMQPSQLSRLNEGPGMSSDVYYSVSDSISPAVDHGRVIEPINPVANETPGESRSACGDAEK